MEAPRSIGAGHQHNGGWGHGVRVGGGLVTDEPVRSTTGGRRPDRRDGPLSVRRWPLAAAPGRLDQVWAQTWVADVGPDNARLLATESRTAVLASEYRPHDVGGGRISYSHLALGASRELSAEEEGAITDDADGLRVWVGDDAFELELVEE